jgi:Resolvase, N terminal domain
VPVNVRRTAHTSGRVWTQDWLRPRLHQRLGPHRLTRRAPRPRRRAGAHLRRPRLHWHERRAARAAPSARCLPRRRRARGDQARPAGPVAARRARDRRRAHPPAGQAHLGGSVHDSTDPVGWLLSNVLAMVAEFEADLIRARTREGMKVAKAKGRLRGKQPKLTPPHEAHLVALYRAGEHAVSTAPLPRRRGLMATATSDGRSTRTTRSDSTFRSSTSFPSARRSQSPCASRSPGTRRSGAAAQPPVQLAKAREATPG